MKPTLKRTGPGGQSLKKMIAERKKAELRQSVELDEADPELYGAAGNFIESNPAVKELADTIEGSSELVKTAASAIKKLSKKQHIDVVMQAYAYWIKSGQNSAYRNFYLPILHIRKKSNPKTTKLHLIVEALISYGESGEKSRSHSKLYSRDVAAIRWLNSETITPSDAVLKAEEAGEGLDKWAARWAAKEAERAKINDAAGSPDQATSSDATDATKESAAVSLQALGEAIGGAPSQPEPDDDHIAVVWHDRRTGVRKQFKLYPTQRNASSIEDCLQTLEAVELGTRSHPFED